jgi:hypothetical protein
MAIPPSPLPPAAFAFSQLADAARHQTASTLAAALITASGRPHSIEETVELVRDIRFALFPTPQAADYKGWEKTKRERLEKVHS